MMYREVPIDTSRNSRNSHGARPLTVRNAQDVSLKLDAPYLIKGFVNPEEISFWYGPSASGKTFFLQYVFWRVSQNQTVLGRRVRGGPVVYFSMEPGLLDRRLMAARNVYGTTAQFIFCEDTLNLFDGAGAAEQIIAIARERDAAAVVIDPISAAMAGANENDYVDVSVVVARLRTIAKATGAHVACVAHTGKDTERGQRGSSHFYASGDLVVAIGEGGGDERTAQIMKARDARRGDLYRFRLKEFVLGTDSDGDEIKTLTVEVEEQPSRRQPPAAKLSKGNLQALSWLREAINEFGEDPPADLPKSIRVTTKDRWTEIARKRTGDDEKEANRKAISRAIRDLGLAGMIGVRSPYFWVIK